MKGVYRTYYQLFRFLICPTRVLWTLFIFSSLTVLLVPLSLYLGAPESVQSFYVVAAMVMGIQLLGVHANLGLLVSRKTVVLCGNVGLHLGIMLTLILVFTALVAAPFVASPFDGLVDYVRGTLLCVSLLFIIVAFGLTWGFNLLFIAPYLAALLWGLLAALTDITVLTLEGWAQWVNPGLSLLVLVAAFLWFKLCRQLYQGRLFRPDWIWRVCLQNDPSKRPAGWNIFTSLRTTVIHEKPMGNRSLLVLESSAPVRDYLYLMATSALPLCLGFYLLKWLDIAFSEVSFFTAFALILLLMPILGGAIDLGNVATHMRRLWLLMPGRREQHLAFLEGQLLKLILLIATTAWVPAAVLLTLDDLSVVWVAAFILALAVTMINAIYIHFLTLCENSIWPLILRITHSFTMLPLLILCWFWRNPVATALIAIALGALCMVLRVQLYHYWARLDMSRLRAQPAGTWLGG